MSKRLMGPALRVAALLLWGLWAWGVNHAASTDLASSPLETSSESSVKPNIFFILDDSGSMSAGYLPDHAFTYTENLYKNPRYNRIYYDPAITYTPPVKYDGTSYPSMTSANSSAWASVPVDGFGVLSTSTTNLSGTLTYYVSIAGEYCTSPNLRTCNTQSAATTTYPYPAYLRWCTSSALSSCQANYISSGTTTYTYPRYPTLTYSSSGSTGGGRGGGGSSSTVPGSIQTVTISSSTSTYAYPGSTTRASTRTDCVTNTSTCTLAEERTNYANWYAYYQTRMQSMKTASSLALVSLTSSYRLGYMSINNNTGSDFLDIADITTTSSGQKYNFYKKLFAAKASSTTPLKKALYTAGRYYAGKLSTINTVSATDPMQYACQRNFTILSTDGYWNESTTPYKIDGSTAIGDQDGSSSGESRPYLDGNSTSNTLADVAEYYYKTDLRSTTNGNATSGSSGNDVASNSYSDGQQRMYTYTLGLGISGYMTYSGTYSTDTSGDFYDVSQGTTTSSSTQAAGVCIWQSSGACNWPTPANNSQTGVDDLWHAAVNGRGTYYSASDPAELQTALTDFVSAVTQTTANSSGSTSSAKTLSTSSTTYNYRTRFCSGKYFGDIAAFALDATTGEETSTTPNWSLSGWGSDCASSSGTTTTALLDNTTWSDRTLFTWDAASQSKISFEWSALGSTRQAYFQMTAIAGLSQICTTGTSCVKSSLQIDSTTAGTTTGMGGINLVNYLRGDRSNEGSSSSGYYRVRTHVMGDAVNANPVYVQKPNRSYTDSGYSSYKTAQASRTAVVYVGANDGMVHAINAGNGAELWAYIPSMLLPKLYKLADKAYAANHVNYVDGPMVAEDVYFDGAWHTILVGGLGQGGRGYFALDVTDPSSPKVLWEFTYDTSASSHYIQDEDLGYSFGKPVVTKLSDGTWAVLLTSGYNNVSPGSGHGIVWVLKAATGTILKKIDNGMGSNASGSVVSGCSAVPCPSGLAQMAAWANSAKTDNTATYLYGGDLYGNVWRMSLGSLTAAGGTVETQLLATLQDASGNRQPVTVSPSLGYLKSSYMVFVATGRYLGTGDISSTAVQSLYALKDQRSTSSSSAIYSNPRSNACTSTSQTQCFSTVSWTDTSAGVRSASANYGSALASRYGWYADLPESKERVVIDMTYAYSILTAFSMVPTSSGACASGGSSYVSVIDAATGMAVDDATTIGGLYSSSAFVSGASILTLSDGTVVLLLNKSDGSTAVMNLTKTSTSTVMRRLSWRELVLGE